MTGEKPLRILVAEDSKIDIAAVDSMLTTAGFEVLCVENGRDAIELLRDKEEHFDAIVTDIFMPQANGLEIAEHNFKYRHLPLVAFTGKGDALIALDILRFGVKDFLLKPLSKDRFIKTVKSAIARSNIFSGELESDENFDGSIGSLSIASKLIELRHGASWIRSMLADKLSNDDLQIFTAYLFEFIVNAYEHGNLALGEAKKCKLMENGDYEEALKELESSVDTNIEIKLSLLDDELAIDVLDQGEGFDYKKYLNMSGSEIIGRIEMPNGKGIFMAKGYFDSVNYFKNGAGVTLVKKINLSK